jgi:hypothetical protein
MGSRGRARPRPGLGRRRHRSPGSIAIAGTGRRSSASSARPRRGYRRLEGGAWVLARPFALHDRDRRQLLVRQAIGLHIAQDRNREQSRRPHRAIGLLELAGKDRGGRDIAGAPDPGAATLAMGDQHRLAEPRGDRRGGVADMDHEPAAADRGAVDCHANRINGRAGSANV